MNYWRDLKTNNFLKSVRNFVYEKGHYNFYDKNVI